MNEEDDDGYEQAARIKKRVREGEEKWNLWMNVLIAHKSQKNTQHSKSLSWGAVGEEEEEDGGYRMMMKKKSI